eukprot:71691-Hanusia_phi.AAC.1
MCNSVESSVSRLTGEIEQALEEIDKELADDLEEPRGHRVRRAYQELGRKQAPDESQRAEADPGLALALRLSEGGGGSRGSQLHPRGGPRG